LSLILAGRKLQSFTISPYGGMLSAFPPYGLGECYKNPALFFSPKYRHRISDANIEIHKGDEIQEIDDALLVFTHGRG
jgi:hypothetical protein